MSHTCIVYGCNSKSSLHLFPTNDERRNDWTRFVQRTRANWVGPSVYSAVCSLHFTDECFANYSEVKMGFSSRLRLLNSAVPSVYPSGTGVGSEAESKLQVDTVVSAYKVKSAVDKKG